MPRSAPIPKARFESHTKSNVAMGKNILHRTGAPLFLPCLSSLKMMIWTKEAINNVLCASEKGNMRCFAEEDVCRAHHELASSLILLCTSLSPDDDWQPLMLSKLLKIV
jgi:hypothetical protein